MAAEADELDRSYGNGSIVDRIAEYLAAVTEGDVRQHSESRRRRVARLFLVAAAAASIALATLGLLGMVLPSGASGLGDLVAGHVAAHGPVSWGGPVLLLVLTACAILALLLDTVPTEVVASLTDAVPILVICGRQRWQQPPAEAEATEDRAVEWLVEDCRNQGPKGPLYASLNCADDERVLWELLRRTEQELLREERHPFGGISFRRFRFCLELVGAGRTPNGSGDVQDSTVARAIYAASWVSSATLSAERLDVPGPMLPLKAVVWLAIALVRIREWRTVRTVEEWLVGHGGRLRDWTLGPGPRFVEDFAVEEGWTSGYTAVQRIGVELITGIDRASGSWRTPNTATQDRFNRLIVAAFLEDLRSAYRPRFRGRGRHRTLRCLLLVRHLEGSDEAQTLLKLLRRPHEMGPDRPAPLLVVASTDSAEAAKAAMEGGGPPVLFDPPTVHRELLVDAPPPRPRLSSPVARRRARLAIAAVATLTLGALAVHVGYQGRSCGSDGAPGELAWAWSHTSSPLLDTHLADDGECIGVTDGSREFGIAEVNAVEHKILQANLDVARRAASNHPYITAVVLTTLTADKAGKSVAAGVNELEGSYLAQQRWNQGAGDSNKPLLKLLIANGGQNSHYADFVVGDIIRAIKSDAHIVIVTGMGQSRAQTEKAIAKLDAEGVPMVASTTSHDRYAEHPHFFRVSPNDARQGAVAAAFVKDHLRGWPTAGTAGTAAVVFDANDDYSTNVADDFIGQLDPTKATIRPHAYHTKKSPNDLKPTAQELSKEIAGEIGSLCHDQSTRLVYYAGRANEFPLLANAMNTPQYCVRSDLLVMADDDVSQLTTPPNGNYLLSDPLQLYFTAWAPPGEAVGAPGGLAGNGYLTSFYAAYFGAFGRMFPSNEHAVLAYDAVTVAAQAAHHAALDYGDKPVDTRGVYETLARMYCEDTLLGASGGLDYAVTSRPPHTSECPVGGAPHNQPTNKLVVVLSYDSQGQPKLVAWCGLVAAPGSGLRQQGAWCPALDPSAGATAR